MGDQVGNEQFKDIVERNTGVTHLNGNIFAYADQYYDLSLKATSTATQGIEHKYADALAVYEAANPGKHIGIFTDGTNNTGLSGELLNGTLQTIDGKQYIYDLRPEMMVGETNLDGTSTTGANSSEVLVGTAYDDFISMQGGDDTAYGDGGNDVIYGGDGMDKLYGGTGNDTIFGGEGPDVIDGGDVLEIYTDYKQLIAIRNVLLAAGLVITTVEKAMRPKTIVQADAADALRALKLIERMEDLDDVQKVYSNLDITDEVAEQFAGT
jgi:Ca2+-binding RTX toxin-like protein